ncbi:Gfo/Idh/MocA family oxidoreductase [Catenulispora sp. NF23]|uniref:Gfo/Idh/MocA family oxidoreductase n=1 Tax=Catenulispora pinistramenti TaxID=2705254 RepID=A0ABS5L2X4_9ACTN|nr:Gfo/Idh/MocA family oxidoreductase [Catenulispora pinistramenti]MBS2539526.1 Gfo/Idh/MocA family oxidoreductase [Catenulispora pinistramenti]MBS2552678.1 Gfo/Idh/MocA family oxidoreductase [Catenulispora pinistramenti]
MTLLGLVGVGRIGALHARTLHALPGVEVVVADVQGGRAEESAASLGVRWAPDIGSLLRTELDGLVVATPTGSHAELIERGVAAGVPVFCEKPVAENSAKTLEVIKGVDKYGGRVQIGFQRRFDSGYTAARAEVLAGALGRVHTLRAQTCDPFPPPAGYIATSGGIFRDCSVHDFDAIRWVTGREVTSVFASGSARGEAFFAESGDADTAAAVLRLDDDALATVTATRYHGAGYAVTLDVQGTRGSVGAGYDDGFPLRPVGDGPEEKSGDAAWPKGPAHAGFLDRFREAYVRELQAFVEFAAGRIENPCPVGDALEALYVAEACDISRAEDRPVKLAEVRR